MQFMRAILGTFAAVLAAALLLVCSACEKRPDAPAESTPAPSGVKTPAQAGQPRVVVLSPALAITLKDLGLESMIVGRHAYDMVLDKSIPVCGDQAGIDYEALLSAQPTHVILQWGSRPLPERLSQLATEHGWIIVNQELLTLADIRTSAVELFDILAGPENQRTEDAPPGRRPRPPASPEFRDSPAPRLLERMDSAFLKRSAGFATAGRVLLMLSTTPPSVVGPGSFHQQVLEAIGGLPALTTGGPYQELDTEDVANLKPDVIILLRPRGVGSEPMTYPPEEITRLLGPLAGKPIPAVQQNRVAIIDDPLCLMPGTSLIDFADRLSEVLNRWNSPR